MMPVESTNSWRPPKVLSVMATWCSFMLPTTEYVRSTCGMRPSGLPVSHSTTSSMAPFGCVAAGQRYITPYSVCESAA